MRRALVLGLLGAVLYTDAAAGHGPCECIWPRVVEAGRSVQMRSPAIRVIFNPRPSDLGIAPGDLAGAYRPEVATSTVLERPRRDPMRRARFRVPRDASPGLYMVLVFDGSEGGQHNTWDYVHVRGAARPSDATTAVRRERDSAPVWPWVAVAAVAGLAGGVLIGRRRRP